MYIENKIENKHNYFKFEISRFTSQDSCCGTDCHSTAYSIIFLASINPKPKWLLTKMTNTLLLNLAFFLALKGATVFFDEQWRRLWNTAEVVRELSEVTISKH